MKKSLYMLLMLIFINISGMNISSERDEIREAYKREQQAKIQLNNARSLQRQVTEYSRGSVIREDVESNVMDAMMAYSQAQNDLEDRLARKKVTLTSRETIRLRGEWPRAQRLPTTNSNVRNQTLQDQSQKPVITCDEIISAQNSVHNIVEVFCKSGISRELGLRSLQRVWSHKPLMNNAVISEHLAKHISNEQATDLMNGVDNSIAAEKLLTAIDPTLGSFAQSFNKKRNL